MKIEAIKDTVVLKDMITIYNIVLKIDDYEITVKFSEILSDLDDPNETSHEIEVEPIDYPELITKMNIEQFNDFIYKIKEYIETNIDTLIEKSE
jgi:hypothetical protein